MLPCHGGDNQKFYVASCSGAGCTAEVKPKHAIALNKCIGVTNGSPADGVWLVLWDCNGNADQKWNLDTAKETVAWSWQAGDAVTYQGQSVFLHRDIQSPIPSIG